MSKTDFLYELLPVIYRQRDLTLGAPPTRAFDPDKPPGPMPMRSLFAILQEQYDLLEGDIASLYDNWFVETCEPWALPYIADLVAVGRASRRDHPAIDARSLVANTLAYRRRKGLATTLERALEDASGWPSRVVAFADLLGMTATARCPGRLGGTIAIRDGWTLACLGGAFDTAARTADVRPQGRYDLKRAGIFVWRLPSYPMRGVTAGHASERHKDRLTFHPLGRDMPLFNRRLGRGGIDQPQRAGVRGVPEPLTRRMLAQHLAGASRPPGASFFGERPAFAIHLADTGERVAKERLVIADLAEWKWPAGSGTDALIAVDPERGRLRLGAGYRGRPITTDHCYGFAGDIGGGPYFEPGITASQPPSWQVGIGVRSADALRSLSDALNYWAAAGTDGLIEIADSRTYDLPADIDLIGAGNRLIIRAAPHQRPCLAGALSVTAQAPGCSLVLEGLLIDGPIHTTGDLALTLRHCTMVPPRGRIAIAGAPGQSDDLRVLLESTVVGPLRLPGEAKELRIFDSIVDGGHFRAIASPSATATDEDTRDADLHHAGPPTVIARATLFGEVVVAQVEASDAIFTAPLKAVHDQHGFVRHCYVPEGSRTPQRFRCQPEPAPHAGGAARQIRPAFTSVRFGHPGYGQLAPNCPRTISAGGAEGAEIGAFHRLGTPWREQGLHDIVAEYLPFGLHPHIIYAT